MSDTYFQKTCLCHCHVGPTFLTTFTSPQKNAKSSNYIKINLFSFSTGIPPITLLEHSPPWKKPRRYFPDPTMSEKGNATAAAQERIARYKEERRRQLAAQYRTPTSEEKKKSRDNAAAATAVNSSSSSDGPRTTRTSRLRAAAAAKDTPTKASVGIKSDYGVSLYSFKIKFGIITYFNLKMTI